MNEVTIYTDGACSGNPGKGGWGAILIYAKEKKYMSGSKQLTTNNQMELTATIEALKAILKPSNIALYTDSQYVKNGITSWIFNWKKNGWKTANKKPVANKDLWLQLYDLNNTYNINWNWVKAHETNTYNNLADEYAVLSMKNQKSYNIENYTTTNV